MSKIIGYYLRVDQLSLNHDDRGEPVKGAQGGITGDREAIGGEV